MQHATDVSRDVLALGVKERGECIPQAVAGVFSEATEEPSHDVPVRSQRLTRDEAVCAGTCAFDERAEKVRFAENPDFGGLQRGAVLANERSEHLPCGNVDA